ncbi:GGDEF domain-containing protein [Paenibacillus hamazuiensis]|uniref:GGDEF domain-containing protein n=1 Tax=Paenibacillus hamazuiensis TaxID=2936508 RepID=UPI00200D3E2D|nr:GGDEF domain-containing protein [Paenibacillus hamazuiensis]
MNYRGRIFAVSLTLLAHTCFAVYFAITDGRVHFITYLGYILWFFVGYWIGHLYDKARYYAEKDPLTDLYNRRFITSTFGKITSLTERTQAKLFVLIIDCDNFKSINDMYGHQKGDFVLASIGRTLSGLTRKSDIVARWGGDEFLVIGHLKQDASLQTVHQRLTDGLKALSDELGIPVFVSIGSAVYPDHSTDLTELIKIADTNMYIGKRSKKA